MKYKIPVIYEMYGFYEIEADNVADAVKSIFNQNTGLPREAHYIDGSIGVDEPGVNEHNTLSDEDNKSFESLGSEYFI